jgi:hypothetical protein
MSRIGLGEPEKKPSESASFRYARHPQYAGPAFAGAHETVITPQAACRFRAAKTFTIAR